LSFLAEFSGSEVALKRKLIFNKIVLLKKKSTWNREAIFIAASLIVRLAYVTSLPCLFQLTTILL